MVAVGTTQRQPRVRLRIGGDDLLGDGVHDRRRQLAHVGDGLDAAAVIAFTDRRLEAAAKQRETAGVFTLGVERGEIATGWQPAADTVSGGRDGHRLV